MASIEILGCRVDAIERDAAVARIVELARERRGLLVVTLGVEMVMWAQRDPAFRTVVNAAALCVCDTIGLLLASRAQGGPLRSRLTGVDLVAALAERSACTADLRLYLLGGRADTARAAAAELARRYPGARISGARDGYFPVQESEAVAAQIAASGATVLCLGLGSPKQEAWFAQYGASTKCGVGIGVGGALDVFAGTVTRAPRIVRAAGLEWAYRLVREPRRWRRQLALPRFVVAALGEIVMRRMRRSG